MSQCFRARPATSGAHTSVHFLCLCLLVAVGFIEGRLGEKAPALRRRAGLNPHLQSLSGYAGIGLAERGLLSRCELRYRNTTLDHFSWAPGPGGQTTYSQRYFVCSEFWEQQIGPIFFYCGNEADVTLYLNNTGLMWENAEAFGALLVFAEHRYYGESMPFGEATLDHMQYLTAEQALADYAELLRELKAELGRPEAPVVGFGGSYGGMLAAWMRMKYPHVLAGSVAASAPIWAFMGLHPPLDTGGFNSVITRDATPAAGTGAAPACADNVRSAFAAIFASVAGASQLSSAEAAAALRLCPDTPLETAEDAEGVAGWAEDAWSYMAMGNYPYPSTYILNGHAAMPAFPVTAACSHLADPHLPPQQLLEALANAIGVFYNASGSVACYDFSDSSTALDALWNYQYCTEMFMPFSQDGRRDMFYAKPFDKAAEMKSCQDDWGVKPRPKWASTQWGGRSISAASNIVFSNGLLDPWSAGGVLEDISDSLHAVVIPEGAHHLDLMWSTPQDPPSVTAAREKELALIQQWVAQAAAAEAAASHPQAAVQAS